MPTNTKIELLGAKGYRSDLEMITKQSKTLAAEMKQVASSFDSSTSAEEKHEKTGKKLNEILANQKDKVALLQKELEKSVTESGEFSKKTEDLREKLARAETEVNNTKSAIAKNNEELERANKAKAHEAFEKIGKAAKVAAEAVAAIGAAAVAAGAAILDVTKKSGEWADGLLTLSQQTDISTQTLQEWEYAARFIDTEVGTMQKGLAKVAAQSKSAVAAGKDYIETLDGQKISLYGANGEMKTSETLFYDMIDYLGTLTDETEQNAAAQDLFGKSFQEMKPLINAGTKQLQQYGAVAERLGLVMGEEDVKKLGAFDDTMQRIDATMEMAGKQIALSFIPATQEAADNAALMAQTITQALADGFQEKDVDKILDNLFTILNQGFSNIERIMPALGQFISQTALKLAEFVTQNLPLFVQVAMDIIMNIATGLAENLPALVPTLIQCILSIAETLTNPENLVQILDAGVQIAIAIVTGIVQSIPDIIVGVMEVLMNIGQTIVFHTADMVQHGFELMKNVGTGIADSVSLIAGQVGSWVQSAIISPITGFLSKLVEVGKNIVKGIWEGISGSLKWIKDKLTGWIGDVLSFIKRVFKIESPSKLMRDEVGKYIAMGIGVGITDNIGYVTGAMRKVAGAVQMATPTLNMAAETFGAGSAQTPAAQNVVNIYPQSLSNAQIDYIFQKMNTRIGVIA